MIAANQYNYAQQRELPIERDPRFKKLYKEYKCKFYFEIIR